ncbi:xylulokinase [Geoglobus acetivorans]|uniref:Carbohydrate kinase n=1 Tax=Geoglobus acetivorans TaxID=565033 RepID=A0A0A7GE94_GEOAI|nr:Carbohydrate kinase [Geoglobus acetivorans]
MPDYFALVDAGTTSIKAGIVESQRFKVVREKSEKTEVVHPKEGYAEKDPEFLWEQVKSLLAEIIEGYEVRAIAFTAHMAGFVPVDRNGDPLFNMVIWLDERGKGYPEDLFRDFPSISGYSPLRLLRFLRITGGAPSKTGKDVLPKILWMRDNEPEVFSRTWKFLDVKGYLIYRCTGKAVTSHDEAHLTWLADTRRNRAEWHEGLMRDYGLKPDLFPEIMNSTDVAGFLDESVSKELGINRVPVVVGAGDMCTTAIGSGAVENNRIHIYLGTSDWIGAHVDKRKADVKHYIGTILSGIPEKYLLVAEQEIAGGAIDWVMNILNLKDYEKVDEIVKMTETDLIFTPWFFGERAPIDDHYIRASIFNLSLKTGKDEMLRALFEGVAMNIAWAYHFVEKMTGTNESVRITGGGARFDSLCSIIASAINRKVVRTAKPEHAGLRGLATIVNTAVNGESCQDAVKRFEHEREFHPDAQQHKNLQNKLEILREYYRKTAGVFKKLNRGVL